MVPFDPFEPFDWAFLLCKQLHAISPFRKALVRWNQMVPFERFDPFEPFDWAFLLCKQLHAISQGLVGWNQMAPFEPF